MPTSPPVRPAAFAARALLGALAAWLLAPVFTPAHVEGFSAAIASLGLHLNGGDLPNHDPLFPANYEFFLLSRLGSVLSIALLSGPLGLSADWAFRTVMWLGAAGLWTASYVLIRRWSGCRPALAVAALLVVPGAVENTFFYNDNVLAAALALGGLAVVATSRGRYAAAGAGLLFGAAVVARTDVVLLAPAVALVGYGQDRLGRAFVERALAFAAGTLLPVIATPAAFHATIFDVLRISRYAVFLWDRSLSMGVSRHAHELLIFVGVPAAVLAAAGAAQLVRARDYHRLLLLAGVPLLFNAVSFGKLWQSRQALPLTPFVAALVVCGWQFLAGRQRVARLARPAVAALTAVVFLSPPRLVELSDGPRARYGRLWTPLWWRRWQAGVNDNVDDLRRFADALPAPGPVVVLTDTWNADHYLHLVLQEQGYAVGSAGRIAPECGRVAELFERRDRRVLVFRLHVAFLSAWPALTSKRMEAYGAPCLAAVRPPATFLLTPVTALSRLLGAQAPTNPWVDRASEDSAALARVGYHPQVAVRLDDRALATLRRAFAEQRAEFERTAPRHVRDRTIGLAGAERLLAAQIWPHPPGAATPPGGR